MDVVESVCNSCGSRFYRQYARGRDFEYQSSETEWNVVECMECGLVYLNPRPAPNELATIYPSDYIPYQFEQYLPPLVSRLRMWVQQFKTRRIRSFASKDARIWDVGCGGGGLLKCLKRYGSPHWRLVGVDLSSEMVNNLKAQNIEGVCGQFELLDIEGEVADVVILNQVIEHLDNPAAVVEKTYRILSPGGIFFIETPSLEGWDAKLFKNRYWGGYHFPRHWTFYTSKSLRALLVGKGFDVISVEWLHSPNFWAQSFHHWLSERGVPGMITRRMDCRNLLVMVVFTLVDSVQALFGHTSNFRIVARKPF